MKKREIPDVKTLVDRYLSRCREAHVVTERMLKHNRKLMCRSEQPEEHVLQIQHMPQEESQGKPKVAVGANATRAENYASHESVTLCWHECPVCQRHWSHRIHVDPLICSTDILRRAQHVSWRDKRWAPGPVARAYERRNTF
jgi:hypothetical protein